MNGFLNLFPPQTCYLLFGFKLPLYLNFFVLALIFYKPFTWLLSKKYFRWFLIFLVPTITLVQLFRNDFFFQSDDFAHLKIVAEYSFGEIFLKAMGPSGLWGFHHIFIGLWLFKLVFIFFGVNVEAYIIVNFLLHLINLGLLFLILSKINKSSLFNLLGVLLMAGFYQSWISSIWELTTAFFVSLTVFLWLNWLAKPERRFYLLSIFFFLLALFSYEKTALLPIVLLLISLFYHYSIKKINFKRLILFLLTFFFISFVHFLIYGRVYFGFFSLGGGDGYSSKLSLAIFLKNLSSYLSLSVPIINFSVLRLGLLVFLLACFDFWKKKLVLLPLFLAYLLLLSPALFFEGKIASYYGYTPSFFLFMLLAILFTGVHSFLSQRLKKKGVLLKIFNIYFVIFVLLGIFNSDKFLMDNCFLIHYPWSNPHRVALNSLSQKLDKMLQEGKIEEGVTIKLEEKEITHEMEYLFGTNALYLFLKEPTARDFTFVFDEARSALLVEKSPSYRKISF